MAKNKKQLTEETIQAINSAQQTTKEDIEFFPSGITLLDLCLGGGWGKGFISNICGWESAGKTLITCETIGNNCRRDNQNFEHHFDNSESGFTLNTQYLFGFKMNLVRPQSETIEIFMRNVEKTIEKLKPGKDCLYVLDSLDGISDSREKKKHEKDMESVEKAIKKEEDIEIKEDYGGKAKGLSRFFRLNNSKLLRKKVHLMITSQLREKIGVIYGKKEDRTGGKALKFYAAQIVWLYVIQKIMKKVTVNGRKYERHVSTLIKAVIEKNKLGKTGRFCYLFFDLDYGVDNIKSNIYFLFDLISPKGEIRDCDDFVWDEKNKFKTDLSLIKFIEKNNLEKELEKRVKDLWNSIEEAVKVERKKKF